MGRANYEVLSARLKVLAHSERLRILDALRREPECVCHQEALLGKSIVCADDRTAPGCYAVHGRKIDHLQDSSRDSSPVTRVR